MPKTLPEDFSRRAMTFADKVQLLESSAWLKRIDWHTIETLARYVDFYDIEEDKFVFRQGDTYPYMCLIISGEVEIRKAATKKEGEKAIARIGRGHTFGEMTLIDGEPRSATAIVTDKALLCVLTEMNFQSIRHRHPALWGTLLVRFMKTITTRLRRSSGLLVDLMIGKGGDASFVPVESPERSTLAGANSIDQSSDMALILSELGGIKKLISALQDTDGGDAVGGDSGESAGGGDLAEEGFYPVAGGFRLIMDLMEEDGQRLQYLAESEGKQPPHFLRDLLLRALQRR